MTLQGIGQFYRFLLDDVFAPGDARHRVHRMHIDGMHDPGKRNPGNAGNIYPVVLIGIALDKGIFFYLLNSGGCIPEKAVNIIIKISIAETELIALNTDRKGGVHNRMFNDAVLSDAAAEFRDAVSRFHADKQNGFEQRNALIF